MSKVVHYRHKCIGCNSCVEHAPNHWKMNEEDGKTDLIGAQQKKDLFLLPISIDEVEENKKAARDCPVKCIQVLN